MIDQRWYAVRIRHDVPPTSKTPNPTAEYEKRG